MLGRGNLLTKTRTILLTQRRTTFTEKYKHGPTKLSNHPRPIFRWIRDFFGPEGWQFVKEEAYRFVTGASTWKWSKFYVMKKVYKFEKFETLDGWKAKADSDTLNGFSHCTLTKSPTGHALFSGVLDNRVPDDGVTGKSGFAAMIGPIAPRKPFTLHMNTFWDWREFNTLEVRLRGDGRKYRLVCHTGDYQDDTRYYDAHAYPIYTTGGPYWQTIRIPFSKFIFAYKGLVQDSQHGLNHRNVKLVAFCLEDHINGPFSLEIDYIGLLWDTPPFYETCAYELYSFPHIKYRPLQVGCDPPEQ